MKVQIRLQQMNAIYFVISIIISFEDRVLCVNRSLEREREMCMCVWKKKENEQAVNEFEKKKQIILCIASANFYALQLYTNQLIIYSLLYSF